MTVSVIDTNTLVGLKAGADLYNSNFTDTSNAASKLVGTAADQVPTNADVRNPRNRIVNPTMAISQENGDGLVAVPVNTNTAMADQIFTVNVTASGAASNIERVVLDGSVARRVTITTASTDLTGTSSAGRIEIPLEAQDIFDLNGGDVSIACKLKTNFTGNVSVAVVKADNSRSYVSDVPIVSGVTKDLHIVVPFEIDTVPASDNSKGLKLFIMLDNEGTSQTATLDQWQAGNFRTSTTATKWTKTINNYVEIANVDLYAGNVPREFQPNSYSQDLVECQRYFIDLLGGEYGSSEPVIGGVCFNDSDVYGVFEHNQMRTIPALINSASGHFSIFEDNANVSCDLVSVGALGLSRNELRFRSTGNQTSGNSAFIRTNNVAARLALNARL